MKNNYNLDHNVDPSADCIKYIKAHNERSFSKHLCLVVVIFEKPYIFQKSIFKKMPPDTPRSRIRDLSGASLLVVKGFPKSFVGETGE